MPSLLSSPSPAKTTTLEIRGASYAAQAIDPGFAGVAAVRVVKLVNPDCIYDVVLTHHGRITCDCPDYIARHEERGSHCKHCKAAIEHDLLIPPVSGGSPAVATQPPAVVAPITEKDLKRASYFGMKLPAAPLPTAPVAIEAPAPAVEPTVADPGDDWSTWDDSLDTPWGLGPEVEPIEVAPSQVDLTGFASRSTTVGDERKVEPGPATLTSDAPAGMEWVVISPGFSVLRSTAPDRVYYPIKAESRPIHRERIRHTAEDEAAAVLLFADRLNSCLDGESGPPIGDRSFPRKRKPARSRETGVCEYDLYPAGAWS